MSEFDDLYDVTQPPISDELAERLLSGSPLERDTASVAGLDAVFHSLRAPAASDELSGMEAAVDAFQGALVRPITCPTSPRTRLFKKRLTTKAIAAIGAVTFVSAGAAAAATGTVPSPFASHKAEEVPTEQVPDVAPPNVARQLDDENQASDTTAVTDSAASESTEAAESTEATEATQPTEATQATQATEATEAPDSTDAATDAGTAANAVGPDATGPAKFGLCTAFAAHKKHGDEDVTTNSIAVPVAFRNLADAAAAAGQTVEQFCAEATPGNSASAPGHSDGSPSATAPKHNDDNPPESAAGKSEHGPASIAPGRSDHNPSNNPPGTP